MDSLGQNAKDISKYAIGNRQSVYIKENPQSIHLTKILKTQANVYRTFYNGYDMHNRSQNNNHTQEWKSNMRASISSIILSKPTKPLQANSTKITQPMFKHTYRKTQQQLKNPRNQVYNHEILRENKKAHTFSWRLKLRWWREMVVLERNTMSLWERRTYKTMNSKKCSKENWKVLKIVLKAQNKGFFDLTELQTSCQDKSPNTLKTKFLKNLSKCFSRLVHPRGSREGSCETFWVNLATGASTREQVAK